MRLIILAVVCGWLLAGCVTATPMETARMPQNAAGGAVMTQDEAIALSSWALKDPTTTRGNPALAARAIAAADWLAGQRMLVGDFGEYAPVTRPAWQEFRAQLRAAVGIAVGTPSQLVVDRMLAVSNALKSGNQSAAAGLLADPAFTLGPDATLLALANLPALPSRSRAYYELNRYEGREVPGCRFRLHC